MIVSDRPASAVFLSYASQDTAAVRRLAEALREHGVEVWFDQNDPLDPLGAHGLVGGDAWDAKIRKQIKECALFVPVISSATQARTEGYFRLEWRLADQRTHLMAKGRPFLLPVVIDGTRDSEAHVPDSFNDVQWTRLPLLSENALGAFCARVQAILRRESPANPIAAALTANGRETHRAMPPTTRRPWLVASLLVGSAALLLTLWFGTGREKGARAPHQADHAATISAVNPAAKSIAVLPFASPDDDKATASLADGVAEELLYVLGNVPGLQICARTSSFHFKGRNVPVPEIARQLGVGYVVEGTVRRRGEAVRITAQLIKASDGFKVWSDTFERDAKDVLAVQDEIAGLIARSLSLTLDESPRRAATTNLEAHRLYLEGRYFWNLRTEEGFVRSEKALLRAVELDPLFARAHAGLADLYVVRGWYHVEGNETSVADFERARSAAQRALELDPTLAEPHATYGVIALVSRRTTEAERLLRKTLDLAPNYATAHNWYAELMLVTGRLDEALQGFQRAAELDPLSPVMLNDQAKTLLMARRPAQALALLEREEALSPGAARNRVYRGRALEALGRKEEAIAVLNAALPRLLQGEHSYVAGEAVSVLRQLGREQEAHTFAADMLARLGAQNSTRGFILTALGDFDSALAALPRNHAINLEQEFWHPMFDPIREDPRFARLLEQLNCVDDYKTARTTLAGLLAAPLRKS